MTVSIVEYDQVDPFDVLNINLLSLNYALTPERVALIRQHDPRPFPFFGLYAVEDGFVAGQVGVYRLPMMTNEGPEDVGGVCAVCTHPAYSRRGIATLMLKEAHRRMQSVGLRFSTLGTARHRGAYSLYQRLGYEDVFVPWTTFATITNLPIDQRMHAERAGKDQLYIADELFNLISIDKLGFATRHANFFYTMSVIGEVNADNVWLIYSGIEVVGYAIARTFDSILVVDHLLLKYEVDAIFAISSLANRLSATYIQIRVDQFSVVNSLVRAGFSKIQPNWSAFLIKPLDSNVAITDAYNLFGIGTVRFLISKFDIT